MKTKEQLKKGETLTGSVATGSAATVAPAERECLPAGRKVGKDSRAGGGQSPQSKTCYVYTREVERNGN